MQTEQMGHPHLLEHLPEFTDNATVSCTIDLWSLLPFQKAL
jgi:hypothetical protein